MKCPKCGFDQPTDRFCANCGVDVALFEPKESKGTGIFPIGVVYFLVTTLVVGFGLWYFYTKKPQPEASRVESVFKRQIAAPQPKAVEQKPASPPTPPPSPPPMAAESKEIAEPVAPKSIPEKLPEADTPKEAKPKSSRPSTFKLTLLEIDPEFENEFLGNSSDQRVVVGIAREDVGGKSFSDRFKSGLSRKVVSKISSQDQVINTDENGINSFNFTSSDSLLTVQLKAIQIGESGTTIGIEGRKIIGHDENIQTDIIPTQELSVPLKIPAYVSFKSGASAVILLVEAIEQP